MAIATREILQSLSNQRRKEAKYLLDIGCYSGSYYFSGFSVELALKACIAKNTKSNDFPDKKIWRDAYQHDLTKLVSVAGLKSNLQLREQSDAQFQVNWSVVKIWSNDSRYESRPRGDAEDMYRAISKHGSGILQWIRQNW